MWLLQLKLTQLRQTCAMWFMASLINKCFNSGLKTKPNDAGRAADNQAKAQTKLVKISLCRFLPL